ncbi:MAG: class I SAM-dependent methyltransferase [Verrucomicrobia bacterium]|nr:class I SAM-dependent methyltransferase [Deltaproteobacteria bacterium]
MSVFNEYARYYDLLYRDKDYAGETDYVHNLIQAQSPDAKTILNLGCGSGRHDRCLADRGYAVTGVDLSGEMLTAARETAADNVALEYVQGDARTVRLGKTFDVVISLFHVMSYQITNADLMAAFATAYTHLKPGGIFIFDCWYGPGVLTDRPAVRVKELEDETISVTRLAQPVMHPNENVVDVNYRVFLRDKVSCSVREICETHRMRYLFLPESQFMLSTSGFEIERFEEWLTSASLNFNSWNAVFVCRRNAQGVAV